MKKNKAMRAASVLLVLTLVTSCFVSGTFAKYVTKAEGSQTARVAKFGVELTTFGEGFYANYLNAAGDNKGALEAIGNVTVTSSNGDKVVAPGTADSFQLFQMTFKEASPEVAVEVKATLDDASGMSMIALPAKDGYTDYTVAAVGTTGEKVYDKTFNVAEAYHPIQWKLTFTPDSGPEATVEYNDGSDHTLENVDLKAIDDYFKYISKDYYPDGSALAASNKSLSDFKALAGTYKLYWFWAYEGTGGEPAKTLVDQMDTYLGNVMAGVVTDVNVKTNETVDFSCTVTQID